MRTDRKTAADVSTSAFYQLPGWSLGWFYATALICTWDASFILLRPHTLPGGVLFSFWRPYSIYIEVDQRYKDLNDPFVYGISIFNLAEVVLDVITIILHHKKSRHTVLLALTVSVITAWKTVFYLYGFTDLGGGADFRLGNSATSELFLVVIPNGVWIVVPCLVVAALWSRIIPAQLPLSQWDSLGVGQTTPELAAGPVSEDSDGQAKGRVRDHVFHAKHA